MTDQAITALAPQLGVRAACEAVGAAQAGYYRRHRQSPAPARPEPIPHRQRHQPRALSTSEQRAILDVLHSDRFADLAPAEVWAILLDEGVYLGSESTFYRLLRQAGEVRERRRQATHPAKVKPELVADAPNEVWSWDITKLRGPAKWTHYYLYVFSEPNVCSILSRFVSRLVWQSGDSEVGWYLGCGVEAPFDLGEFVFGPGKADLESLDLAEPSLAVRFGDAGCEVVAYLG
jgi:putative transposase